MGYLEAMWLGFVQGLTEFLPVSSSGHLVVFQRFFQHDPSDPAMILFDLAVHLGTVVAVVIYYRESIQKYFSHLFGSVHYFNHPLEACQKSISVRITIMALVSTFATGVFYVIFHDMVKEGFGSMSSVGVCWLITATLLLVTDRRKHVKGSLRDFGLTAALIIGLAQGIALFPGVSRSGSTICVAVLFGLRRRWAGEFSFLIGVPAILGASLIEGIKFFSESRESLDWGPIVAGSLVSCVVGLAALSLLIWAVRRAKLKVFAIYCYVLGIATLAVVYWPQSGV